MTRALALLAVWMALPSLGCGTLAGGGGPFMTGLGDVHMGQCAEGGKITYHPDRTTTLECEKDLRMLDGGQISEQAARAAGSVRKAAAGILLGVPAP